MAKNYINSSDKSNQISETKGLINLFKTYFDKRNIDVNVTEKDFNFKFSFDLVDVTSINRILAILDTLTKIHKDILIEYECKTDLWYPELIIYFDKYDDTDEEDEEDDDDYFDEDDDDYDPEVDGDHEMRVSRDHSTNYDVASKYKGYITFKMKDGVGLVGFEEDIFDDDDDDQYWTKALVNIESYLSDNNIKDVVYTDRFSENFGI